MGINGYKWYGGVPHSHTNLSDGKYSPEQLIAMAVRSKLDYLIITDHNRNCDELPDNKDITLIYGAEYTKKGGHANIWGVKDAVDSFEGETYEEFLAVRDEAKKRGAVVCMNHPLCVKCPWRWEKDVTKVDVLEIWNGPMHYDNLVCTDWWHDRLREGHKLPIVGGSDYHRDYVVTKLLACPTTYVYARSAASEDILDAIVKGRTTITNSPGNTFIELECGDAMLGDTVSFEEGMAAKVSVKKLKKNHTLTVFDNEGECFTFKADKTGDYSFDVPVRCKGFMCAHVTFELSQAYRIFYNLIIGSKIPSQKGMRMPPFIYAQSGAMYFE